MSTAVTLQQPQQPAAPAPGKAAAYWMATRAYSFPASIASVLLGTALALRSYGVPAETTITTTQTPNLLLFVLTLVGAVLAQAAGNVLNDYFDYKRGVDTLPEHGGGVLTSNLLTTNEMLRFGVLLLVGAAVCGGVILLLAPAVLPVVGTLAVIGALCAVLYTPFAKRIALGDVTIMIAFGVGLSLGAYAVQTALISLPQALKIALLALPLTLLVDAILHANNMRDVVGDRAAGVHTLAGVIGEPGSNVFFALLLFGPVALVVTYVLFGLLPLSCLGVLLVIPVLVKAFQTRDVPFIAQSHLLFGLFYSIGVAAMPHR